MTISDLSIRRPVFATVLSLLLVILGLMAALRLPMREYPDVSVPVVSVDTTYRGASSSVIESRITQPLEDELAGIEGLEKLTSASRDESSRITLEFAIDRNLDAAANDVRERVSRVAAKLPQDADPPQISKVGENTEPVVFINFKSRTRNQLELTDYVERYVADRFAAVPGAASVRLVGTRRYAMRIWLDKDALAARQLTVTDVENALRSENVELPAGRIESQEREFTLRTDTSLSSEEDFRQLVVGRGPGGYMVRLGEVAQVRLAADDVRSISRSDGLPGLSVGVLPQSKANILEVAEAAKAELKRVQASLPKDIDAEVNIDFSAFIVASMTNVAKAVAETLIIVLVVIYLFLGSVRATLIPAVTIPVSLLAGAMVSVVLGYSINTLSMLAVVLAIGLVVDDAIVVLENIVRRVEAGEPSLIAAMNGSREIGFAVIATTLVLCAVFVPISYLQGSIGRLFSEFGVTVAAAVAFSALVALTLTPMMTSKLFTGGIRRLRLATAVDEAFRRLATAYEKRLRLTLRARRPALAVGGAMVITAVAISVFVFGFPFRALKVQQEFTPTEDRAMMPVMVTAPEGASLQYLDRHLAQIEQMLMEEKDRGNARRIIARSGAFGRNADVTTGTIFMPMTLWNERKETSMQVAQRVRQRTADIPGVRIVVVQPPSLAMRGIGKPLQLVIGGSEYGQLVQWRDRIIQRIQAENPRILNLESDYQERKPQLSVRIDRNKAADLGVSLSNVGRTLETLLGSRIVTTFVSGGEEYNVVVQARDEERSSVGELGNIYVRSDKSGALLPLSSVVQVEEQAGPSDLKRFDRLRAITISGTLAPGYSLGEALAYSEGVVRAEASEAQLSFDGESRELKRSESGLWLTFGFALLIVYLVLAAQFESFVHPVVILATVPLALVGALVGLFLYGSTINIFSQIGAIMLIGIACKNGILIVEFANQLRDRGVEFVESVVQASVVRLRPVLMTSLCTAFGAIPLLLATGAGAESRQSIGATVFFGVIFSLVLTLFIVPALYVLIARNTKSPEYVSRLIERLRGPHAGAAPVGEAIPPGYDGGMPPKQGAPGG